MMHVSEIGFRPVSTSLSGHTFGMGQVVADFHIMGSQPSLMPVLNMQHIGPNTDPEKSFRTGMLYMVEKVFL